MKKKTQKQRVAEHLFKFGSITRSVAENFPHPIKRLSSRIGNIKDGPCRVVIKSKLVPWGNAKQSKYSVTQEGRLQLKFCLDKGLI